MVLDPFIGSGTTAIACIGLNRHYVGIEVNEEYIKIANERIKSQSFIPNNTKTKQRLKSDNKGIQSGRINQEELREVL